jgi:mono/diheme cytochrome c family protein
VGNPGSLQAALTPSQQAGRTTWFNSTFGGEKFFSLILPSAPFNLQLGFDSLVTSNRDTRFDDWGVINDPDCVAGDASTGFLDRCSDPNSSGIVGVRKFPNPNAGQPGQPPVLLGASCAACHAGLDAQNPPADPNHPAWENIHATTGNQYLQVGKLFGNHLSTHDPRYQVFHSWAPGTVDTTAIESDHVNNPGIITQFFSLGNRPFFNLTEGGQPITVHRAGQGGEDDAGCQAAALRVYFNIGMCAAECMVPHLANGPGGTQTPIDQAQCARDCPDFVQAQHDVVAMCDFMTTTTAPSLQAAPGGNQLIDNRVIGQGKQVFEANCASCHSNGNHESSNDVLSNDLINVANDIGTNSCRSKTTNWEAGHIWAAFSSDQYKQRPTGGPGFYRNVPLIGVWATAPFLHNNRLGVFSGDSTVKGRVAAYEEAMSELLNPFSRDFVASIERTSDSIQVPSPLGNITLPAGTPIAAFANLDPNNPLNNLCPDYVENQGHYFGSLLSASDKYALREYLKTK